MDWGIVQRTHSRKRLPDWDVFPITARMHCSALRHENGSNPSLEICCHAHLWIPPLPNTSHDLSRGTIFQIPPPFHPMGDTSQWLVANPHRPHEIGHSEWVNYRRGVRQ